MSTHQPVIKIALATPLRQVFDYMPHEGGKITEFVPGARVQVPFGRQKKVGIVLGTAESSDLDAAKLKRVLHIIDTEPLLDAPSLQLLQWAHEYYHHPLGDTIFTALPTRLREGKDPYPALLPEKSKYTTPKFQSDLVLNSEQQAAIAHIQAQQQFSVTLLEGITGSGKTLVYMHLIKQRIEQNQQALVLIPEIGLTPQTVARFEKTFQCQIAALHSALTPKKRAEAWMAARHGEARIVIGTRSAIFTPMPKLGMIIIDEEHDMSFKQQEGFRYSARDLAVVRAQQQNIPLVLGTATPSCETYYNAKQKRYQHVHLTERAGSANPPTTQLLDIRNQTLIEGLSKPLLQEVEKHCKRGGQALLFVNRRGFAPTMICHQCGWVASCQHCDARLTWHKAKHELRCHHCLKIYPVITDCRKCQSPSLMPLGVGTQRLEEALAKHLPQFTTARIDRDTTGKKGELERALKAFANHETDILIGTQMLAKGHNFKDLTLVAILDIDSGLYSSDFRAIERMGQLILQVAGRAGRAHKAGNVILQTYNPTNPLLQILMRADYTEFLQQILQQRQMAALPPYQHIVMLRADANKPGIPLSFLNKVREKMQSYSDEIEILGPIPALMEKRADRYRAQLCFSAANRGHLRAMLSPLVDWMQDYKHNLGSSLRWSVDVDPQEMF